MGTMGKCKGRESQPDPRLFDSESQRGSEIVEGSDFNVRVISALEMLFLGACSILLAPFFFLFIIQLYIQHTIREYRREKYHE